MKRRLPLLLLILAALLSVSAYAKQPLETASSPFMRIRSYDVPFSDVSENSWFSSCARSAYEYGFVEGRGNGTFAPNENITLAELLTLSARLNSTYCGSSSIFPSAGSGEAWYLPYVSYLRENSLLPEGLDDVTAVATRAQMAAVFAHALPDAWYDERNADLVTNAYASRDFITDVNDYTPYQREILWMYKQGLLVGTDNSGNFCPGQAVTRAEITALLTRMVEPAARLTPEWVVLPYHSAVGTTLPSLVEAAGASSSPDWTDSTAVDAAVRKMLASGENHLTLTYPSLTRENAAVLVTAFVSGVKVYCEQMYNKVSISYTLSGRAYLTFSSTACTEAQLQSYRERTLAKAIEIHDALWESGALSYGMSEYEIARTYFVWLCENCSYDNLSARDDSSLCHLAYSALANGKSVCDGYTGAYNLLLKLEGIDCRALFNADHIWTVAVLDGVEYHIDTTWGDQYGRVNLSYFGMTAAQSRSRHAW